jgi:hypothetical protein
MYDYIEVHSNIYTVYEVYIVFHFNIILKHKGMSSTNEVHQFIQPFVPVHWHIACRPLNCFVWTERWSLELPRKIDLYRQAHL